MFLMSYGVGIATSTAVPPAVQQLARGVVLAALVASRRPGRAICRTHEMT